MSCYSSGKPNNWRISRGALDYPRTAIVFYVSVGLLVATLGQVVLRFLSPPLEGEGLGVGTGKQRGTGSNFTPPLAPPLKREGKGPSKTQVFRRRYCLRFSPPCGNVKNAPWSVSLSSVEREPFLRGA